MEDKWAKHKQIALNARKHVVTMSHRCKTSHIGSALSMIELLTSLYKFANIEPSKPDDPDRDRILLSKGHGVSGLYAVLAETGFIPRKRLDEYACDNGSLCCMPTIDVPGVEISTGGLGHGLSMGLGMALAAKLDSKDYRVFVVLGDGECQEGSTWEAALAGSHYNLDNLVAIVDYNKWQAYGRTNEILNLEPFAEKWRIFGCPAREIDGHDFGQIQEALEAVPFEKGKPSVIISHTVKGKGVSFLEDTLESHYRSPDDAQFKQAMSELEEQGKEKASLKIVRSGRGRGK